MKHVAILSNPTDFHAHAVHEILERKGAEVTFFSATDFPSNLHLTIRNNESQSLPASRYSESPSESNSYSSVWVRRPNRPVIPDFIVREDRNHAIQECERMRDAYFHTFATNAFWVNPYHTIHHTENKILQQQIAMGVDLQIPDTLFSNDPKEIRSFLKQYDQVIYKTLTAYNMPTTVITAADLPPDEILSVTPGIFQPLVKKAYELRVTVIGQHFFPARINSQGTTMGEIDWRKDHGKYEVTFDRYELPPQVKTQCVQLMKQLGIVYGCIDFIVSPAGEYYFLEINQSGQFLFLEQMMKDPWPLADAMAEMLLQARPDFDWQEGKNCIQFDADVRLVTQQRKAASMQKHLAPAPA